MPSKGHPQVNVRIHPEALRRLKEHAEQLAPGRQGGVSDLVRRVLYEYLGFPGSSEWDALQEGGAAPDGR